jgi:F-type H+-transporting ATPase subunit gamma
MVALTHLRSRLRAVENIKKITTSMEMVASARLRKAQIHAKKAQDFIAKTHEILERLERSSPEVKHPLMEEREIKKMGVVIISSDRGLCGAYNNRIFSLAERFLADYPPDGIELILFGRKAIQYFRKKRWRIRSEKEGWSGKFTLAQIRECNEQWISDFLSGALDAIWFIYTEFHSLMVRNTSAKKFLPIKAEEENSEPTLNYIFEPDLETIYLAILSSFCMNKIESMLNQSYASELAARIFAMKAASNNAAEMEEALTLERNKVRQASITREILETISSTGR